MTSENNELIELVRSEMRSGFALLATAIGGTNSRLDSMDNKFEKKFDQVHSRLDSMDNKFEKRCDGIDQKLDVIAQKVDGIASFLLASERNINSLEVRLFKLENRVDEIERDRPAS